MLTKVTKKIKENIYFYPKIDTKNTVHKKSLLKHKDKEIKIIIYIQHHTSKRDRLELNYFAHGIL